MHRVSNLTHSKLERAHLTENTRREILTVRLNKVGAFRCRGLEPPRLEKRMHEFALCGRGTRRVVLVPRLAAHSGRLSLSSGVRR